MGREILSDLKIDTVGPSSVVQKITEALGRNFETVAGAGIDYTSLVLAGGAGFGDFNLISSDIDVWLIMPNLSPLDRLQRSMLLNFKYGIAKRMLIENGVLHDHNFRHPPTLLTEDESIGYRKAFSAKVGLPMSLGVFPTLSGLQRRDETCFTEGQLLQDLAYSCGVFQENLLNPPQNSTEDPLRYCYKRATYFLRFKLLYEKGIYVPRQDQLLSASEQSLPEWQEAISMLRQIQNPISFGKFQDSVSQAMQIGMTKFINEGLVDEVKKSKGEVRTRLFWTIEKLRWDYLLLPRDPILVRRAMKDGGHKSWGFSYFQVDSLFKKFFKFVPDMGLIEDWARFRNEHLQAVTSISDYDLTNYYDRVYHPSLISFFDKAITFIDRLY